MDGDVSPVAMFFLKALIVQQQVDKGLFTYYLSRRRGGREYGKCWRLLTKGGGGVTQKLTIADEVGLGLKFSFTNGF